jgi:hypothetical protein
MEVSTHALELIKEILIVDPSKRITISDILNSAWLNGGKKKETFVF